MKSLLPHQIRILEFIEERESNGKCSLIAHDPGCGKTEPILHYLNKNKNTKSLIIAPACIRNQWVEDIDKLELNAEFISFETGSRLGKRPTKLLKKTWKRIVIDEAHKLGIGISQLSRFCLNLKSDIVICITGTPVVKHKRDMMTLAECLKYDNIEQLVEEGMLYESKDDVLNLPPLIINIHNLTNSEFVKHHEKAIVSLDFSSTMKELIAKRMASLHPGLVSGCRYVPVLTKIELLNRLVSSTINNTIIFTNYLKENRYITKYLLNNNPKHKIFSITGKVKSDIRDEIFNIAKSGKRNNSNILYHLYTIIQGLCGPVLLKIKQYLVHPIVVVMQQQIGGVGLNLQAFETIYFPNPSYCPASDFQALCRSYRLGQNKPVTVHFMYANKEIQRFIDNRVCKLRNKKLKTIKNITKIDLFKAENINIINYN